MSLILFEYMPASNLRKEQIFQVLKKVMNLMKNDQGNVYIKIEWIFFEMLMKIFEN
jgi:hypothetical protein